jgi:ATP-dependent Clp protease ATP-binding subunit ClpA
LKRAIQKEIETPLGRLLLKGDVQDGQTVSVDFDRAKGLNFTLKTMNGVDAAAREQAA